jgi:hypothetical protein
MNFTAHFVVERIEKNQNERKLTLPNTEALVLPAQPNDELLQHIIFFNIHNLLMDVESPAQCVASHLFIHIRLILLCVRMYYYNR